MTFDWAVVQMAVPLLTTGLLVTLKLALASGLLSLIFGFALGLLALSQVRAVEFAVAAFVDFIRGTPLLIQVFLIFFALPAIGLRFDEVTAGILALSINTSAYVAETVRGGVGSVERGQTEAAKAIGMRRPATLIHILLPQALRPMLPPLTNELISMTKNTSLLSVISVYELTRAGQAIVSTHFAPVEIFLLLAIYYYLTIKVISLVSRRIEARMPGL